MVQVIKWSGMMIRLKGIAKHYDRNFLINWEKREMNADSSGKLVHT